MRKNGTAWEMPQTDKKRIKTAKQRYIASVGFPLTRREMAVVVYAKRYMARVFRHGWHQLAAVIVDSRGRKFTGKQFDFPQSANIDAEIRAMTKAVDAGAKARLLVTVHHKRAEDGGAIHVVNSCGNCLDQIFHFYPEDLWVVVYSEGELWKVPLEAAMIMMYKRRAAYTHPSDLTKKK